MATYPDPLATLCRNAPIDDEPDTEEQQLVAEADEWRRKNGGQGIPDDAITREFETV